MSRGPVTHPLLGTLQWEGVVLRGELSLREGGTVKIQLKPPTPEPSGAFLDEAASRVLEMAHRLEEARDAVVDSLFETYQDRWPERVEAGSAEGALAEPRFRDELHPKSITVSALLTGAIWFDAPKLFLGASIFVGFDKAGQLRDAGLFGG